MYCSWVLDCVCGIVGVLMKCFAWLLWHGVSGVLERFRMKLIVISDTDSLGCRQKVVSCV